MSGLVSLVGAGPGDPELLTVRAVDRLRRADLVLYDALVSKEALALAVGAHRFFVGKRAGRKAMRQETINRLLVRGARRGQRVVRLKCGDPFVLGRGGEEALALARAGVDFEVVPGLSTAVSGPALAGIPVTHRGLSSAVLVLSGHAPAAFAPLLGSLLPGSATVVVLMGLAQRAKLVDVLRARGWDAHTPCAVLYAAGSPTAQTWVGRLDELAFCPEGPPDAPGTLCIGEVVRVREELQALVGATHERAPRAREEA
jgi:uroporphyrin-III C-methyltransferase / precorrin-2 dehydrogenase / sirohydrochlorin ferrochelatase